MRRILVIGGGIAGVESALTLARGLSDDHVTLLTHSDVLRVMPDLVYVPTGVAAHRMEVPVRELLAAEPIDVVLGEVASIDLAEHVARVDTGDIAFDIVVVAPGAAPLPTSGLQLQTLDQAELVRDRLDEVFAGATAEDERASIVVRTCADDAWGPPAYEFVALLAARRCMLDVERLVSVTLVTAELQPFQWFEPHVADVVLEAFTGLGVELATGVPEARFDDIIGDVVVDFGRLEARHVPGLPGRDEHGWYATDSDGRVHADAFVVGDAACHPFKSAFAVAWQARRMLVALGGSLDSLGERVGDVPIDAIEHHVDLGTSTLRIRMPVDAKLHDPWLGHDATVHLDDAPPDRLAGLLVGVELTRAGGRSAAHAHRALVTRPGLPHLTAGRPRLASHPTP
ncbi:MAG: FAD-dependent pyridine nucleotide-disulfide oxidoreductase [Thermoleophilia bacterium]|nr:FAD-dependent pyridine nucleotide-disulfide oxidoreductase [Thermoleophilia bacterium]